MRIIRFRSGAEPAAHGAVVDESVHLLEGSVFDGPEVGALVAALNEVEVLAPCKQGELAAVIGRRRAV